MSVRWTGQAKWGRGCGASLGRLPHTATMAHQWSSAVLKFGLQPTAMQRFGDKLQLCTTAA
jgi:hypothetical protein